jgi:hypothetical protein
VEDPADNRNERLIYLLKRNKERKTQKKVFCYLFYFFICEVFNYVLVFQNTKSWMLLLLIYIKFEMRWKEAVVV